jgi:hypothetical protein
MRSFFYRILMATTKLQQQQVRILQQNPIALQRIVLGISRS